MLSERDAYKIAARCLEPLTGLEVAAHRVQQVADKIVAALISTDALGQQKRETHSLDENMARKPDLTIEIYLSEAGYQADFSDGHGHRISTTKDFPSNKPVKFWKDQIEWAILMALNEVRLGVKFHWRKTWPTRKSLLKL